MRKGRLNFDGTYRPFTKRGSMNGPQKLIQLIIFFAAELKDIFIKSRKIRDDQRTPVKTGKV